MKDTKYHEERRSPEARSLKPERLTTATPNR